MKTKTRSEICGQMIGRQESKTRWLPRLTCALGVWIIATFNATVVVGEATSPQQGNRPAAGEEEKVTERKPDEAKTKSEKPSKKKEILAVTGADIITVSRETIRDGTILIEDGKITALGNNIEIPDSAKRLDASGKTITPGFVAISASRVGITSSGSDRNARYADSLDPFDRNVSLSLGVGITTACLQMRRGGGRRFGRAPGEDFPYTERFIGLDPDEVELRDQQPQTERDYGEFVSLCPCCGLPILPTEPIVPARPTAATPQNNVVIKMSYGKLDGMLVKENALLDMTPGSLSGALNQQKWREQIAKAKKYLEDQAAHEKAAAAGKKERPPRKPVSDQILQLVKKEIRLRIPASSISEIQNMVLLAKELDYQLVISGASESWVNPQELSEGDVGVILTPRSRRNPNFGEEERSGTWIETPRVLEESGVPFAIATLSSSISLNGLAGRDLTSLPLETAYAVRGGASERKALAAITIVPAEMLGVSDRIGSLEVGKDADLLVLNGPPLDYRTYVETAIVNGRIAYERNQAKVLPVYER